MTTLTDLEKDDGIVPDLRDMPNRPRNTYRKVFCSAVAALVMTNAVAQESAKPTVEDVSAQANSAIRALRAQRDEANDRIVELRMAIEKLGKELEAAKAAKPEGKP